MQRKILVLAVLLAIGLGAAAWKKLHRQPVQIGFIAGLTGKYADLGIDCRRGVELAIRKMNRDGGVAGRQIVLESRDDSQDKEQASIAVQALLQMKPEVIIGHATSSMTMATLPLVNASSTLLFSPTSSTVLLQDIDDNFLRTCSVSTVSARAMARYLIREKRVRRAGIIYDLGNEAYTKPWFESFRSAFMEGRGDYVLPLTFSSGQFPYHLPLVQHAQGANLDILIMVTNSADAAMFCQQVRKIGWQIPIAMADWAATEQLITLGGRAVEGVIIQQIFNRKSEKESYVHFKNEFERLYRIEPGFGALHAYDAAMIVFQAMNEQVSGETLKQAILRIGTFQGLQYPVVINRYGDSSHSLYMGLVRNGKFEIVGDFQ